MALCLYRESRPLDQQSRLRSLYQRSNRKITYEPLCYSLNNIFGARPKLEKKLKNCRKSGALQKISALAFCVSHGKVRDICKLKSRGTAVPPPSRAKKLHDLYHPFFEIVQTFFYDRLYNFVVDKIKYLGTYRYVFKLTCHITKTIIT